MTKKKETLIIRELTVTGAGAKGRGIAKSPDGRVIFIPFSAPGDLVDVQVTKKRRSHMEGRIVKIHEPSKLRTSPKCKHFGICGGCKWQHLDYKEQLAIKEETVRSNLIRIGHLELPRIMPILAAPQPYYYRNKMEFSFSNQRWLTAEEIAEQDTLVHRNGLGLHIPGRWDRVLDLQECLLQAAPSNEIRLSIRNYALENAITFFDPKQHSGVLRTLMIRTTSTGEIMVLLQCFEPRMEQINRVLEHLKNTFPQITSLLYVINQKANDTLYDQEIFCYAGKDHLIENMDQLKFKITAKSFYQTNSEQAHSLYKVVKDFASLKGDEIVYDLYSGTGTIAQFIASDARQVIGIESVPDAVEAARENAKLNGITNTQFHAGDMRYELNDTLVSTYGKPDVVITDPPRDGMHKDVIAQLLKMDPPTIVYVSCNSATQARDLALLDEIYAIEKVQPVDMFPQTHHVENVVLLKKRSTQA
ncbi:MAG: 23S rRNA (uracil(1939)-C(5))-methyltransferase RlmD [Flavobacteriaceae bacterium]|nr:23S rRNA (uracil(1939)-C(5))-methyltransferase RlmD [Flavobacteriaceae bacterium]